MVTFRTGIPTLSDYQDLVKTDLFRGLEAFSNQFLMDNQPALAEYSRRVVPDPLHTWSRLWEYPFAYARILDHRNKHQGGGFRILDAGSGVTFFPFYLACTNSPHEICCLDEDRRLIPAYQMLQLKYSPPLSFQLGGLHHLPYENESFDVVYCISVLEHTVDYESILREFSRVLRPQGLLIITFDISLDNQDEITPDTADQLVNRVLGFFPSPESAPPASVKMLLKADRLITPRLIAMTNPKVSFWHPLRNLDGTLDLSHIPHLTFYCLSVNK